MRSEVSARRSNEHQWFTTVGRCQGARRGPTVVAVMDLAIETQAYQAYLEGHRAHPDDDDLYSDLQKARAAMEVAWLQLAAGAGD